MRLAARAASLPPPPGAAPACPPPRPAGAPAPWWLAAQEGGKKGDAAIERSEKASTQLQASRQIQTSAANNKTVQNVTNSATVLRLLAGASVCSLCPFYPGPPSDTWEQNCRDLQKRKPIPQPLCPQQRIPRPAGPLPEEGAHSSSSSSKRKRKRRRVLRKRRA